jgi:hypothetical protein
MQSEQDTVVKAAEYVLEVKLTDGDRVTLDAGSFPDSAQAELTALAEALESAVFVRLGDQAIVRASDVRTARIRRLGGRGDLLSDDPYLRDRGDAMSTYGTEPRQDVAAAHTPMRAGTQHRDQPGFIDQYIGYGRRPYAETKPFWMTSEFLTLLGTIAGIALAMGTLNNFNANRGWLYITIVAAAYIVSRGIAKAGARDPNPRMSDRGGGF